MFHRPSFSPVSFSRISFNGASQPVEQDGRSGYWRLFFTQLQEEADKEKQPVAQVKGTVTKKPEKKLKLVKKQTVQVEDDELEELPHAPIARPTPQPEAPCYLVDAWRATTEVRGWLLQHRINTVKYYLIHEAANEEEEDIELLLLAA